MTRTTVIILAVVGVALVGLVILVRRANASTATPPYYGTGAPNNSASPPYPASNHSSSFFQTIDRTATDAANAEGAVEKAVESGKKVWGSISGLFS